MTPEKKELLFKNIFEMKAFVRKTSVKNLKQLHKDGYDFTINNGILLFDTTLAKKVDNLEYLINFFQNDFKYFSRILLNFSVQEKFQINETNIEVYNLFFKKMSLVAINETIEHKSFKNKELFLNHFLILKTNPSNVDNIIRKNKI